MPDVPEPSDEEMVRRVHAGDAAAAARLFDRHLPRLRAAARARIPGSLRAKVGVSDVVQEAYVAAFCDLSRFEDRGDGSFRRWLRRILENKVASEIRRLATRGRDARREVRLASAVEPPAPAGRAAPRSPPSQAAAAERAAAVRAAVDSLPPDQRDVIRLVHVDGLSFVEAGARMGRSPDATRMLYHRAMDRVADRLWPDDASGA